MTRRPGVTRTGGPPPPAQEPPDEQSPASQAVHTRGSGAHIWVGASRVLGRPVFLGERYPHICRRWINDSRGDRVKLGFKDCAACGEEQSERLAARHVTGDAA